MTALKALCLVADSLPQRCGHLWYPALGPLSTCAGQEGCDGRDLAEGPASSNYWLPAVVKAKDQVVNS